MIWKDDEYRDSISNDSDIEDNDPDSYIMSETVPLGK